ncbi:MAG: SDR family oxidoreductase [Pseudomonadota bacterium]
MNSLANKRVLLTGATGGIGSQLAQLLLEKNCMLGLVGRCEQKLDKLSAKLIADKKQFIAIKADICNKDDRLLMLAQMQKQFAGIDILINLAGSMDFINFQNQSDEKLEQTFQTNIIAPMLLCKQLLPEMLSNNSGHIVNIGSIFGSIGFAYFTGYSASKFALRGFSEALRRELAQTPIKVSYIAPRAVKTSLNSEQVYAMAEAVKMNMDKPEDVARKIVIAIEKQHKEVYLGFPESLFVRINALFPRLVDFATKAQNKIAQKYAVN